MKNTDHNYWKTFYELLIKNYIETTFEPNFCNLEKSECPDFKSDSVGLEIVTATTENQNKLYSFIHKFQKKKIEEIPDKLLGMLGFDKNKMYQPEADIPLFFI